MPDERLITEIESILQRVVELGAEKERTRLGPGLLVTNSAPAGLTNYVLVRDDRDGDNILALKVPGVIYNTNDLVNVLFVRGGEAIAIQQATGSSTSGIWGLVPATSTDIFYNSGDVGIGKAVAPDARLEILDTAQAQLRLTYTEDTKFVNFTLDTNHDLTIKPSSTGQIILQPTTDSTDFFQVLDADAGTPIVNVDSTNEAMSLKTTTNQYVLQTNTQQADLFIQGADASNVRTAVFARFSNTDTRGAQNAFIRARAGETALVSGDRLGAIVFEGHDGTDYNQSASLRTTVDGVVAANTMPMAFEFWTSQTAIGGLTERFRIAADGTSTVYANLILAGGSQSYEVSSRASALTLSSQTAADDNILELYTNDGDGTDFCGINLYAVGTRTAITNRERLIVRYTPGSTLFEIFTEADGTGTLRPLVLYTEGNTDQLYLDTNGRVAVTNNSPAAQLHVDQASTTAAIPVLYLDQADVSEEMIEFNTTIGVGNAIEAVGAKSLTTTHFIKVTLPGALTRYIPVGTIA